MGDPIFITEIKINEVRHLKNVTIPIVKDGGSMKHLILTGKNGSGKTSVLKVIALFLQEITESERSKFGERFLQWNFKEQGLHELSGTILSENKIKVLVQESGLALDFSGSYDSLLAKYCEGALLSVLFDAKRNFLIDQPKTIENIALPEFSSINFNNSNSFLKYLVFLRAKLTDAHYTNKIEEVRGYEKWFAFFESTLRKIFSDEQLRLEYDSASLNFNIIQTNKSRFDFNTLSDGYAAILRILTELMMRMETKKGNIYDVNGIVLIDEIETHLHIELQKSILPFLTAFFPNVQFIVTTHSPFILNSIENAVVYDLENNLLFEDASELSYSSLIKNYFLVDSEYSHLMERKIADFERLTNLLERTEGEDEKLADLLMDLKTLSPLLSPEMYIRFQQAQKRIMKKAATGN